MATEKPVRARRVIIADDHPTILRVVRQILDAEPRIEVVGEATNGLEAVGLVETLKPDVVVLNVAMPRMSGFEAAQRIRETNPAVAVVILSTHTDEQFLKRAKELGAKGYVHKNKAAEQLVRAVDAVAEGHEYFL